MGMSALRTTLIAAATLGFCTPATAVAQANGSVDQIGAPQAVGMQQVGPRQGTAGAARAMPQLSAAREGGLPVQLTSERGSARAAEQLTRGARSAQPSQALSQPRDGRSTAVERLAGDDRCDPGTGRARPARCAQAIETRAAEFAPEQASVLSPEQSIIAEQQARERAGNFSNAARRLAVSGVDAKSLEAQGVASVALGGPAEEARPTPARPGAAPSQEVMSIINAIVNAPAPR
jgi:hypothetical protein